MKQDWKYFDIGDRFQSKIATRICNLKILIDGCKVYSTVFKIFFYK